MTRENTCCLNKRAVRNRGKVVFVRLKKLKNS